MKNATISHRTNDLSVFRPTEGDTFRERMACISAAIGRRAYELFQDRRAEDGHDWEDWFRAESELLTPLRAKVIETDGELLIRVGVPGITDKDVEVVVEPERLIICSKKTRGSEQDTGTAKRKVERSDEMFQVIDLPHDISPDKITATLKDGILEVKLPKVDPGRKIPVAVKAA